MEIANTKKQEEKTQWKVYRKKREKEIAASITPKGLYSKVVFLARLGIVRLTKGVSLQRFSNVIEKPSTTKLSEGLWNT